MKQLILGVLAACALGAAAMPASAEDRGRGHIVVVTHHHHHRVVWFDRHHHRHVSWR